LALALGFLAVVLGAVWTMQGLGYLGGSAMTGERVWAVVGPVVALAGLVVIAAGLRSRRRRSRRRRSRPPSTEAGAP
jgi:hypothetical protein